MRRILLVTTLMAMFSTLSGCTSLALAGGIVLLNSIQKDIQKQKRTRHIAKQKHERFCREAKEKERIKREQLASRRAEELRRRQEEHARKEAAIKKTLLAMEKARLKQEEAKRRWEAERRWQEQLASRRAEKLRRRQREDAERRRRREEQERLAAKRQQEERNREQWAMLPGEAKRFAASLGDVRRELGEIVEGAVDIEKRLLGANLNGPKNQPLEKEQDHSNE